MLANQHNYTPTIEVAVLKSLGKAGEEGKRDVVVKVESGTEDLNQNVKTVTIGEINQTNLSIKFVGFDTYIDDENLGVKKLEGQVYIVANINGVKDTEYLLHSPVVAICPIGEASSLPNIQDSKKMIQNAWYTAFGEALSDIIDQTTVITGNVTTYNPYTLDSKESTSMKNPKHDVKGNKVASRTTFWVGIVILSLSIFLIILSILSIKNKGSEESAQGSSNAIEQMQYDESPSTPTMDPTQGVSSNGGNSDSPQVVEAEVLDEFGLESNVSLD